MSNELKHRLFYWLSLWVGVALVWVTQGFWLAFIVFAVTLGSAVTADQVRGGRHE
jgi:hypothetical protein